MPRRRTFESAASAVVLLLVALASVSGRATSASGPPLCTDIGNGPVLQDSNWQLLYPATGYHDFATKYLDAFVMEQGSGLVIYVREQLNATGGIFRGTSPDGRSWKVSNASVLNPGPKGSWDAVTVFSPDVVWNGTGYLMYYTGNGATNQSTFPANFRQIGVAFSSDGISWTKYAGNPVITHGPGTYDARFTRVPSVIYDNGTYKMWYFGTPALGSGASYLSNIDYATSADGVHWTKYAGNPVFTGFVYSSGTVAHWPAVLRVNGTYLMAFSDGFANIGYATSSNGVNWSFNNRTNLLETLSGWHNGLTDSPTIVLSGNRLLLWYAGYDNSNESSPYVAGIGFATCGLLLAPPPVTTVSSTTVTATSIPTSVSTSISTSIQATTLISTTTAYRGAPLVDQLTAGVLGFGSALALAAAALYLRVRSVRRS